MWPSYSGRRSKKEKICSVRWHKTFSMRSVSRYNSKMAQDIEKCNITQKLQLLIANNFCLIKILFNAFLRPFSPKNRIVQSGQRPNLWGDQRKFYNKSCVLWLVTTFVWKFFFVQHIFKALFPRKTNCAFRAEAKPVGQFCSYAIQAEIFII